MEHMFFEVQLCIKISMFKEKLDFDILIILPSVGSLLYSTQVCVQSWLEEVIDTQTHEGPV